MLFEQSLDEFYGFINGISALLIVIFACSFSLVMMYKARKIEAKFLIHGSLMGLFTGLLWLGPAVDFIWVTIGLGNLEPRELYVILAYMWVAPSIIFAMFLSSKLIMPDKTKLLVSIFLILGIIFEILLFLYFLNPTLILGMDAFTYKKVGAYLDTTFVYRHPLFILIAIFLGSTFIFLVRGSIKMAKQSPGILREKALRISLSFILFIIIAICDTLIPLGIILVFSRMGMVVCAYLLYSALKPEKKEIESVATLRDASINRFILTEETPKPPSILREAPPKPPSILREAPPKPPSILREEPTIHKKLLDSPQKSLKIGVYCSSCQALHTIKREQFEYFSCESCGNNSFNIGYTCRNCNKVYTISVKRFTDQQEPEELPHPPCNSEIELLRGE